MPIREFKCSKCGSKFETLVFSSEEEKGVACPKCSSKDIKRCMSVFTGLVPNGGTGAAKAASSASGCSSCSGGSCSTCH